MLIEGIKIQPKISAIFANSSADYMSKLISFNYDRRLRPLANCSLTASSPLHNGVDALFTDPSRADLARLQFSVYEVILPLLIATGVVTNVIDLVVLSRPAMRGASYRYLARLALSDLLYLLFNIAFCFQDFTDVSRKIPVSKGSSIFYAHIAVPLVNIFLTMSIYIIVWLSYDRFIAVCFPHKFSARQRLEVVKVRCGTTLAVTILVYLPSPFRQTFECRSDGCCVLDSVVSSSKWYIIYEFAREFYSRFLPAVVITAFNVAIIATLHRVKRERLEQQPGDIVNEARQERERKLVLLLLAITVFFYVSTLPSALYKIIWQPNALAFVPFFRAVADILEVSGHVFNFVLYFLFSPEFRKTLASLHRGDHNNMAMTSSIVQG